MKTSILVILFLLSSQILSQIESKDIINHRDFLKERMNHSTNPLIQSESSLEANIIQNNYSRRTVNITVMNDEFLLTEEIGQAWNGSNWENLGICIGACFQPPGGRHAYQYNESNNLTEDLWEDWDGSNWVNFWKYTYFYNESNYLIEYLVQGWDSFSWENHYQIIYSYDENKIVIEDLWQEWNDSIWVNRVMSKYKYDANSNMIEDLWQEWNDSIWVNWRKNTYTYDANNNLIEYLVQYYHDSTWVTRSKSTYTYDENNNMITFLDQGWEESHWVNWGKWTYTYDANNNLIENLMQDWVNSSWVNSWKNIYTYDANNNLIEDLEQRWYNSSWVNMFRSLYSYQPIAKTYIPAGEVSGVWDYSGSPYFVQGEITIPNDSTLTIEPGVDVIFTGHYKFNVKGRLLAIGTETDTILFTINDTTGFHNLTIPDGGWGGIRLMDTPSTNDSSKIVYCKLQYGKANTGTSYDRVGGAICAKINKLLVSHCMFRNNTCYHPNIDSTAGGGIYIEGNPTIEFCEFIGNTGAFGGAMCIWGSNIHPLIRNNYFHHNGGHGTIDIGSWNGSNTSPVLINNIIANNHSSGHTSNPEGHGIVHFSNGGGTTVLINNTIANNSCAGSGGAIFTSRILAAPLLINNIIYGNIPAQVRLNVTSDLDFFNCQIEGGQEGFSGSPFTGTYQNCIDVDPLFVSSNDFHLQDYSNCIGAAIDSILVGSTMYYCPPFDYEGNPRPNPSGSMPDIGACENVLQNPVVIPEWINYNTSNSGLPGNLVNCIKMDHLGNMWIASYDVMSSSGGSLVKYDGTNWTVYNTSTGIGCLAIDKFDNKWIGTEGLVKFDGTNWTIYNTSNSDLPSNNINCIEIDKFDNKWIGTEEGLVKFDGTNWTIYNTSNSDLPSKYVLCITIDDFNNKWIGDGDNLVKYNDTTWTVYTIPVPEGYDDFCPFRCINIDNTGDKWVGATLGEPGSWDGLIKFDDESFTFYNRDNSELPGALISCITIDELNNKWIGTFGGLAKFDGSTWNIYNTTNSGLPSNQVNCIEIDKLGNKWIGTYEGGLVVFNEGGIVVPVELNSFTVAANGKEVTLNWSTATELNNQGFEIQRKFGGNNFVTVGSVKGNGTTTSPNNYSFLDKLIDGGKYFYRLKQIDFDGTFEYSNVIAVDVRLLDKFTLEQNYPNPFNPSTKISWQSPVSSRQSLKLYDVIGNEVATLVDKEMEAGYHSLEFNASDLPSGVYFYRLQVGSFIATKKLLLLK